MRIKIKNPEEFDLFEWLQIIFTYPMALYTCWKCNAEMTYQKLSNGRFWVGVQLRDEK